MDKKWWTLVAVCTGTFMLLLDVTIVNVALPEIQHGLGASFSDLQWVVDAYALTLGALLLTGGSLADLYGRRLLFTIGLIVFTLGSLLCGLAQSPEMLNLSRGGQGVGGAIMYATSLALLAQTFRDRERGIAFGVWGAVIGVSTALGPILGGVITSGISWRGIFLVNVPIGAFGVVITLRKVTESKAEHAHRPDWVGCVLLSGGLGALVYGMIRASEQSWGEGGVEICMVVAAVLLVAFVVAEQRIAHPMFDFSLFRTPTFVGGSIAAVAMNGSLFAVFLYLVLYLQDVLGYSALGVGLRLLILSGCTLVAATIAGRLSSHVPVRWLIGPGLLLVGLSLLLMGGLNASTGWTHLIPGLAIGGIGIGMVNPPLASTAVGVVAARRAGMASGVNTTFRQVGIAASIAALGSVFVSVLRDHLDKDLAHLPALASQSQQILTDVRGGDIAHAITLAPASSRGYLAHAIKASFVSGINDLLVITAIIALAGAVGSTLLIRSRDFVSQGPPVQPDAEGEPRPAARA